MQEYTATLHGYEVTLPARCKLERLEPATREVTLQLHCAESAPVAMRTAGPLEYTGRDGSKYTYRNDGIELLALDGMLWKPANYYNNDHGISIDELARIIDEHRVLELHPWQYRADSLPPSGMLARDRGTWATLDNLEEDLKSKCDRYAVIGGRLHAPAHELVYAFDSFHDRRDSNRDGCVVYATEYSRFGRGWEKYLCNALQDWHEVNIFDEYASVQDRLTNCVTGSDCIEVLMPEYVTADPYADFWRNEIESHKQTAQRRKDDADECAEKARRLRDEARRYREEAAQELALVNEYAEHLDAYLNSKEA